MSTFMTLTRAEVSFDDREEVLINPQHITEVRVQRHKRTDLFPSRAILHLRIQGENSLTVLALDSNFKPMTPEDAATYDSRALLGYFNQAVLSASTGGAR